MKVSAAIRAKVEARANGLCEYCLLPDEFSSQSFSIEHIIPQSKQGTSELDNLALACLACNNSKYDKTEAIDPVNQQKVALFHPRLDVWNEHFAWSNDFLELVGLTSKGRATIQALKMNRDRHIRLRKFLSAHGKHPPR